MTGFFSQIGYLLTCLEIKLTQTKIQNISAAKIAVTNHQDNMSDFENKTDAGEPNINFSKYHRFLKVNPVWCKVEMYHSSKEEQRQIMWLIIRRKQSICFLCLNSLKSLDSITHAEQLEKDAFLL